MDNFKVVFGLALKESTSFGNLALIPSFFVEIDVTKIATNRGTIKCLEVTRNFDTYLS